MFRYCIVLSFTFITLAKSQDQISSILQSSNTPIKVISADLDNQEPAVGKQTVELKLFYESLCPDCIALDPEFVRVAVALREYLKVYTYPYGNARMTKNADGTVTVVCQHGVPECYGNMLHACALDILPDHTTALQYNQCMMGHRSNDTAAAKCGKAMKIPFKTVKAIKACAKGPKGHELLVHYGEESEPVDFHYVPYVLLKGVEWKGKAGHLMNDVCAAFTEVPEPCPHDID